MGVSPEDIEWLESQLHSEAMCCRQCTIVKALLAERSAS